MRKLFIIKARALDLAPVVASSVPNIRPYAKSNASGALAFAGSGAYYAWRPRIIAHYQYAAKTCS